ncbi:COMPASS component SHG1 [Nakaseomyces bracarensis]|uniref:COMPASS component SHG1 n=1 Tax=Nakaseomyces bracarensis TaxID=273131 RepID=A0ABR4NNZ5_9SACH
MAGISYDAAREVTEQFKKAGHFDKLKQEMLEKKVSGSDKTLQVALKESVADIVRELVGEDEEILFKNRGSTSALVEAQLMKGNYEKIRESPSGVDIEKFVNDALADPELLAKVEEEVTKMVNERSESDEK